MYNRYSNDSAGIRNNINDELNGEDSAIRKNNISTGVTTEVQTTQDQRQSYLDALAGY